MNRVIKHVVQEPPRQETSGVLNKNTGFPEPLSHNSNTTLRHPSADTSPTASIESADVPVSRSHARHSSSFHLPRITSHNSNAAKGRGRLPSSINASDNGLNGSGGGSSSRPSGGNGTLPNGSSADPGKRDLEDMNGINAGAGAGAGTSSASPAIALLDGEGRGGGAYGERDEQGYREGERKKGLLRKMQLHKV